jgi:hypothetical protein
MKLTRTFDYLWTVRNENTGAVLSRDTSRDAARATRQSYVARGVNAKLYRQRITLDAPELYIKG